MVGQIAFFLCTYGLVRKNLDASTDRLPVAAGIQMGNTVITSYIVDSYPLQSMSVITFYAVAINLSAFVDPVSGGFHYVKQPSDSFSSNFSLT